MFQQLRFAAVLLGSLTGVGLAHAQQATAERPNLLLIYADDHAEAAISACGSELVQTPRIDSIAAEGMRFAQSFVANSICGPARATLLTGTHSHTNGRMTNATPFRNELPMWSRGLQAAGYQTAVFGKWHLPSDPEGFDDWALCGGYYVDTLRTAKGPVKRSGYTTDLITDLSLEWLKQRDASRPFALWVSHSATHRTWMPKPEFLTAFDGQDLPVPASLLDDYEGKSAGAALAQMRISQDLFPAYDLKLPVSGEGILDAAATRNMSRMTKEQRAAWHAAYDPKNAAFLAAGLSGDELTQWNYQRYIKDYLRCVLAVDQSVGRLLDYLDEAGLRDNTVVIYTSDQGFYLGEHGWYDKRWMYEPSLRTPMFVRWPGVVPAGVVDEHLVQNIDLAPTLLDLGQAEIPDSMQGRSLVELMEAKQPHLWRDSIYYHYQEYNEGRTAHRVARHLGIRSQYDKLIYVYQHDFWEYYDLRSDPGEMHNRIDDPQRQARIATLKQQLKQARKEFDDQTGPALADS